MFLIRSAFWLSAAFIVMAPTVGMDVGESARSTGGQLVSQGAQAATQVLLPESCETLECMVGRSVLTQIAEAPAPAPVSPQAAEAPEALVSAAAAFPPPRPDWAY